MTPAKMPSSPIPVKILAGSYEVFSSGSVIGIAGEPIEFHLGNQSDPLKFRLMFDDTAEGVPLEIKTELIEPKLLKLTFVNFENALGSGPKGPISIGTLLDRRLLVSFRVYHLSEAGKLLQYTWYLGEAVANG